MRIGDPFGALADAVGAACYRDLPDIDYQNRDWEAWRKMSKDEQAEAIKNRTEPMVSSTRRPYQDEVEVYMFPQTWGSTALGYGGMGGASITSAYTIVIEYAGVYCVYFGCGRLAYRFSYEKASREGKDRFHEDMRNQAMASIAESVRYK